MQSDIITRIVINQPIKFTETMKNSRTMTISIEPDNDMKIAMNVATKIFEGNTSIDMKHYNLCLMVAKATITEMEFNNLTSYDGQINQA